MSLDIVGAGLHRTGTVTLKHARGCLGFKPCYHGFEDVNQPTDQLRARSGEPINWDAVLGNCRDGVDDEENHRGRNYLFPLTKCS